MRDQLIRAQGFSGFEYHARHHELAPPLIAYSEDRCVKNRRMLVNDCFDLT
jgi:hypothetical protein